MRFRELAAATLLILAILMPLSLRTRVPPLTEFDQKFYVGIAYDLRHEGRFTNGYLFDDTPDGQERPAGMQFSPIYPGLLALAAWLDPAFDRAIACQAESRGTNQACPDGARLVRGAQLAMLVGFFLLVWRIGTDVGGSRRIGWITLILALVTGGVLVRTGIYAMTETTTLLLSTAATLAAIAAIRGRHRVTWTILTGVLLSLTALTRPAFLYAYFAACLLGVIVAAWRPDRRRGLALIAVFAMSAAATMAPWIVRNTVQLGHPAITFG
ncbi:MAG TPA: hypothetical protein VNT30_18580, partial [Stellaceae bacterium]|nr:hypothetical protein [Stellaceae bacterium]